jgi:hypothetical protein
MDKLLAKKFLIISLFISLSLKHKAHLHSKRPSFSQSVSMCDYYINYENAKTFSYCKKDKFLELVTLYVMKLVYKVLPCMSNDNFNKILLKLSLLIEGNTLFHYIKCVKLLRHVLLQ